MILWQIWICFFVVCHWYGVSHDTEHCVMLGWIKNTEAIACGIMRNLTLNLTLALSNSMKLWAMLCTATQDRWVMVESPEKMWSTGEGNGKPLQYSCLENPMNSTKRQKDMTLQLACCSPWGHKESDTAEWLNWTDSHPCQLSAFSIWVPSLQGPF